MIKASIPIYVLVIILLIGFFLVAAVTILMSWLSANKCIGLEAACGRERVNFCEKWHEMCSDFNCQEPDWNESVKTCRIIESGKTQEGLCAKPNATECSEAFKED